jgi:flavin reductase (DIM6/NTAB) family NADH-FMN oxidoreductase RutF
MTAAARRLISSLENLPHGVYVLTTGDADTPQAMVATWITQVSFDPALLVLALENDSRFRSACDEYGTLAVHLLTSEGLGIAKDVLKGKLTRSARSSPFLVHHSGIPYLAGAHTVLFCRLGSKIPAGDHTVYVAEAFDALGAEGGDVLTLKDTGWKYRANMKKQGNDSHQG